MACEGSEVRVSRMEAAPGGSNAWLQLSCSGVPSYALYQDLYRVTLTVRVWQKRQSLLKVHLFVALILFHAMWILDSYVIIFSIHSKYVM